MKEYEISNVYVCKEGEGPKDTTGSGEIRSTLLGKFVRGLPTPGIEFWHWPVGGRRTKLDDPTNIRRDQIEFYWNYDGTPRRRK